MRRIMIVALFLGFLPGCASHYHRIVDKGLSLYLKAPEARTVLFASSLDGYVPHPAERVDRKTWIVRMPADREFGYFYIIDGAVAVPDCACRENDEFGSENCIYIPGM
jgi:hypothetical protein